MKKPESVFLIPKAGLVVRDPETREPLPATGDTKDLTPYWKRRRDDGDVKIGTAPSARPPSSPKTTADLNIPKTAEERAARRAPAPSPTPADSSSKQ